MRKFLVVMLVLAIAGGAFASDGEGTWSAWSGSANLNTTFDFYNDGGWYVDSDASAKEPSYGIFGGIGAVNLKVQWDYVNEEWSVSLPFAFDGKQVKVSSKVVYSSGAVAVEIPFGFNFIVDADDPIPGVLPIEWTTAAVSATYTGDNFVFKLGVKDLLTAPALGAVGGHYKFDGAADLVVSTGGAFPTTWWRVSDMTIGAITLNDRMTQGKDRKANWFENVGANGLAFRYNLSEALNFGFAFAGGAGSAMFTADNDFLNDFLFQPTFGVKFSDFGLEAAAMFGIRVYNDSRRYKVPVGHISAKYGFDFGLTVSGDIAFVIDPSDAQDNGGVVAPVNWYNRAASQLYYGLNIGFKTGDISAGLRFRGLDQQSDPTDTGDDRWLQYQHDMKLDLGYNAGGKGLWATAFFEITDMYRFAVNATTEDKSKDAWDNQFAAFKAGASVGYSGLEFDAFTFGASIDLTINPPGRWLTTWVDKDTSTAKNLAHVVGFKFKPTASWAIITNGTIDFAYTLGSSSFANKGPFDTSELSITFAWKF